MARLKQIIPSMFHRRVLLLSAMMLSAIIVLMGRLGWMTIVEGQAAREKAEQSMVRRTWYPTVRGQILDRKGRVLAADRASYDIAVDFRVLDGSWARGKAWNHARRVHKDEWAVMDPDQREELVATIQLAYDDHVTTMMRYIARESGVDVSEIEDQRVLVVGRIGRMFEHHVNRVRDRLIEDRKRQGLPLAPEDIDRVERIAHEPIREMVQTHVLVEGVSDEIGFRLMRLLGREWTVRASIDPRGDSGQQPRTVDLLPGLEVIDASERVYPFSSVQVDLDLRTFPLPMRDERAIGMQVDDVASLVLGRVDDRIFETDVNRRREAFTGDDEFRAWASTDDGVDRGKYALSGDRVGRSGLEKSYEDTLRGLRGVRVEQMQTRAFREMPPELGQNLQLTVDVMLQSRIRALIDPKLGLTRVQPWHNNPKPEIMPVGTELGAGVVVLEIATGEILALVTGPTPPRDGDWARLGIQSDEERAYFEKVHSPYINKAISKPYPPGSVAKAMILCGAAAHDMYQPHEQIEATGHLYPDRPDILRSWIFKQHKITHADQIGRDPDGVDALMVSSNVFFFTLGQRLGPRNIAEVYNRFGVGYSYDLGIGSVWPGSIGGLRTDHDGSDISQFDAIQLGIGQGPVTWTPLHAADAYSTIARMGHHIEPTLISNGMAPPVTDINLKPWAVAETLDGLEKVVSDPRDGTGYAIIFDTLKDPIFNAEGIRVWGKTGTATSSPLVIDPDGEDGPLEKRIVRDGDHSWYVTLVAPDGQTPKYAIAVVVDFGGSGGRVSGPINNQVIHALIAEGYLPGASVVDGAVSP
jgi:penicillin-binding protein 2